MKIAFDVDVLAKQMSINDYVHKVADWGYKYIESPRIRASTRSTSTRCSPRSASRSTSRLSRRPV